jgi:hypothetical protein
MYRYQGILLDVQQLLSFACVEKHLPSIGRANIQATPTRLAALEILIVVTDLLVE